MRLADRSGLRALPGAVAVGLGVVLLSAALASAPAGAQSDIAAFRLEDVSGEFEVRYRLDEWKTQNPGSESFVRSPVWEEELFIRTRSYVYHPLLLSMDVGGGPLLVQYGYESDDGKNTGSETLWNYDARFNFVSRKPYPFTFYFRQDHPQITTGLSGRFLSRFTQYGARGALRPPLMPFTTDWDATHWESTGSGFGTVLDEDVDQGRIRATVPYREKDNFTASFDWHRRNSQSGSPGIEIQASEITRFTTDLSSFNRFGAEDQVSLSQDLFLLDEETVLDRTTQVDTLVYNGIARWRYADDTDFDVSYRLFDTDRTDDWNRSQNLGAGAVQRFSSGLRLNGRGRLAKDEAPGFSRDLAGVFGSADQSWPMPFGSLDLSASVGLDRVDQKSDTDRVTVFDESIVLVGTAPVPLAREFVVEDSVVVTNVPKTQTYVRDVDYRLVTVGSVTTIERLITGSILDGQTVLVTYDALTGGTVEYDALNTSVSALLQLYGHTDLFVRVNDLSHDILSGFSTTPLNDRTRIEVGGIVDYPVGRGWSLGGEYRHTDQDEEISPYVSDLYRVHAQSGTYWSTNARLTYTLTRRDNETSLEDVDSTQVDLSITGQLPGGVLLGYRASYYEDTGGTLLRRDRRQSLSLDWAFRQLSTRLRADYADVRQGDTVRKDTRVTAEIRRTF